MNQTSLVEENIANSNTEIFPSPFMDELNISIKEATQVMVTDIQGKTLFNQHLQTGFHTIPSSFWNAGMYFVTSTAGQKINTQKVIKI